MQWPKVERHAMFYPLDMSAKYVSAYSNLILGEGELVPIGAPIDVTKLTTLRLRELLLLKRVKKVEPVIEPPAEVDAEPVAEVVAVGKPDRPRPAPARVR